MAVEKTIVPIISTAHIKHTDLVIISEDVFDGTINGLGRESGWMIHLATNLDYGNNRWEAQSLAPALQHLHAMGYEWVMFDADGEAMTGLTTYPHA